MNAFRSRGLGLGPKRSASLIDATLTDKRRIDAAFVLGSPMVPLDQFSV